MLGAGMPSDGLIRLGCFAGVFAAMALWEALAPRRNLTHRRRSRWPANVGVVVVNTVLARLVLPAGAVGAAILAQSEGWGLFNVLAVPGWAAAASSVVLLDLVIYGQHVVFHAVPALWRLHRMHHADLEFDVTTGVRFHPVEILLSLLLKSASVIALGAPPVAVLAFEVLLNASSMFSHGNVRLPRAADRLLRLVLVTPDMHRVHHSVVPRETNSNFGFNVAWWDRMFGTYRAQPEAGHERMRIGLEQFRDEDELRLGRMLLQPLRQLGSQPARRRR